MALSGQETVDAAGTAQAITTGTEGARLVQISPLPDNTGNVFIGDSTVSSSIGYVLSSTSPPIVLEPQNYDVVDLYVDAATNGDGVCWIILEKAP